MSVTRILHQLTGGAVQQSTRSTDVWFFHGPASEPQHDEQQSYLSQPFGARFFWSLCYSVCDALIANIPAQLGMALCKPLFDNDETKFYRETIAIGNVILTSLFSSTLPYSSMTHRIFPSSARKEPDDLLSFIATRSLLGTALGVGIAKLNEMPMSKNSIPMLYTAFAGSASLWVGGKFLALMVSAYLSYSSKPALPGPAQVATNNADNKMTAAPVAVNVDNAATSAATNNNVTASTQVSHFNNSETPSDAVGAEQSDEEKDDVFNELRRRLAESPRSSRRF